MLSPACGDAGDEVTERTATAGGRAPAVPDDRTADAAHRRHDPARSPRRPPLGADLRRRRPRTAAPGATRTRSAISGRAGRVRRGAFAARHLPRRPTRPPTRSPTRSPPRGLEPGDRVLLFCENSVEAYLAKIGIAKAGMVAMPLNPNLAPDVVEHLIGARRADGSRSSTPSCGRGRPARSPRPGSTSARPSRSAAARWPAAPSFGEFARRRSRRPSPTSRSTATTSGSCCSPPAPPRCPRA